MNIFKKHAATALALAFIVMPAFALAQSYDNESAEGSCNDEMSESMTCGGSAVGNSYNSYPYQTSPYTYAPSQQQYHPATQNYSSYSYNNPANSYIPASAMPYVNMGYQAQQQYQGYGYPSYAYPTQSQSQYQYQTSNPSYAYGYNSNPSYSYPTNTYGYSYGYNGMNQYGEYASMPQSYSYPSGTYGPFGTQLCYWSDSTTYEPCGNDPQQWVQDPYTGGWY